MRQYVSNENKQVSITRREIVAVITIAIITYLWWYLWPLGFFLAFLFPPLVAAIAGRRWLFYGIAVNVVWIITGTIVNWNYGVYLEGRWQYFWDKEAGVMAFLLGFLSLAAVCTCLPMQLAQRRKPLEAEISEA